jgi:hypothetical protein
MQRPQLFDGINRVRRSATIDFERRSNEVVAIIRGCNNHGEPQSRISNLASANLLPRLVSDHEKDLIKPQTVGRSAGHGEVPNVNRVECSAENANPSHAEHAFSAK